METGTSPGPTVTLLFVEREPMWDGNRMGYSPFSPTSMVEREPMWDGNISSDLLILLGPVEREPMWDGN